MISEDRGNPVPFFVAAYPVGNDILGQQSGCKGIRVRDIKLRRDREQRAPMSAQ